jgi:hypothetical protein
MALPRLLPRPVVGRDDVVLADGKVVGRILQENTSACPSYLGLVDHIRLAGHAGREERHRRDARRGNGEVSGVVGEGRNLILGRPILKFVGCARVHPFCRGC